MTLSSERQDRLSVAQQLITINLFASFRLPHVIQKQLLSHVSNVTRIMAVWPDCARHTIVSSASNITSHQI